MCNESQAAQDMESPESSHETWFTPADILRAWGTMISHEPDIGNWESKKVQENPPRRIRLQRLKALFQAFGIAGTFEDFQQGTMMKDDILFVSLMEYKQVLGSAAGYWSRFLEAPEGLHEIWESLEPDRDNIDSAMRHVEEMLGNFLPVSRTRVGLQELESQFGYPKDDLDEIDFDWM